MFNDYEGYMNQRIAVVGAEGGPIDVYAGSAIGFLLEDGGTDPDLLRAELLEAIRPADLRVTDKRSEDDWGASGPLLHELIITVSTELATNVASAALYDSLRAALRRIRRSDDSPSIADVMNEKDAWKTFADFIEFAMKIKRVRLEEIEQRTEYWYVRAEIDHGAVEGVVTNQRVVAARTVREGQAPLEWPPKPMD